MYIRWIEMIRERDTEGYVTIWWWTWWEERLICSCRTKDWGIGYSSGNFRLPIPLSEILAPSWIFRVCNHLKSNAMNRWEGKVSLYERKLVVLVIRAEISDRQNKLIGNIGHYNGFSGYVTIWRATPWTGEKERSACMKGSWWSWWFVWKL